MNNFDGPKLEHSDDRTRRIRTLNDGLRTTGRGGRIMVARSITEGGAGFLLLALKAMAAFDAFHPDNDPYDEHDFGGFEVEGETLFFKIDYYDPTLKAGSPDPADPNRCTRVLTLMSAADY